MAKQFIKEAYRMQQLAGIINENFVGLTPINNPLFEDDDEDDDTVDKDEEDYDFNAPGKKDEFDTDDEQEPTAKDIKGADSIASRALTTQEKLNKLKAERDEILAQWKDPANKMTVAQFKIKMGDRPQQIANLEAELNKDLATDDEDDNY